MRALSETLMKLDAMDTPPPAKAPDAAALPGETLTRNNVQGFTDLTIAIPAYRDDPARLVEALRRADGANRCEVIIYDDGSGDDALTTSILHGVMEFPGRAMLVSAAGNHGRAHARNRLLAHAKSNWILLLDADMLPDAPDFLARYQAMIDQADGPALIAGGFSLKQVTPTRGQRLAYAQAEKSECVPASLRETEPGRYVFTSNILVHRDVLETIPFDDGFTGWGWEDVDWGLRVSEAYPIKHIDNTATHLGLDTTRDLLRKYGTSGANFARIVDRHPLAAASMQLTRVSKRLARLPGRPLIAGAAKLFATSPLPIKARLFGLKLYRAAHYAEYLK